MSFTGDGRRKDNSKNPSDSDYPTIYLNDRQRNASQNFSENIYRTTRYTWWNFVPKNIFEQFRRFTNVYFLIVIIITCIPSISPFTPITGIIPLIIVLTVSAIRDAYDDLRRYRVDKKENNRVFFMVKPRSNQPSGSNVLSVQNRQDEEFTRLEKKSRKLKVGDMVYVEEGGHLPADIVLLKSSSEDGVAYVETSQLDGETNLKPKATPQTLSEMQISDLLNAKGEISAPSPSAEFTFDGSLKLEGARMKSSSQQQQQPIPITYKNVLLRGMRLRNTDWVIGVIVYAGADTKLARNQRRPPSKFSSLDRRLNRTVITMMVFIFFTLTALAVAAVFFEMKRGDAWYLNPYDGSEKTDTFWARGLLGVRRWLMYFALLSFLIPQSMMVSLDMAKVGQAWFMHEDAQMALDGDTSENGMTVKNVDLNDELGRVQYIFSDKTGTLTQNQMILSKCSISGIETSAPELKEAKEKKEEFQRFLMNVVLCNSCIPAKSAAQRKGSEPPSSSSESVSGGSEKSHHKKWKKLLHRAHLAEKEDEKKQKQKKEEKDTKKNPLSHLEESSEDTHDEEKGIDRKEDSDEGGGNVKEKESRKVAEKYKSPSPDEEALMSACQANGIELLSNTQQKTELRFASSSSSSSSSQSSSQTFEKLAILEFSSARGRMSVVMEDSDKKLRLYCKGSDTALMSRVRQQDPLKEITQKHLDDFATNYGLRTLVFATKELDRNAFEKWNSEYSAAAADVNNPEKEKRLDELADELEKDLELQGASGIEDKLQDGVPDTLSDLIKAGVKVWVITGDKPETAINIGYSSRLLERDMKLLRLPADTPTAEVPRKLKALINEQQRHAEEEEEEVGQPAQYGSINNISPSRRRIVEQESSSANSNPSFPSSSSSTTRLALVMTGDQVKEALSKCPEVLAEIAERCAAVLCCRVTPLQKAELVKLIQHSKPELTTLAIGDGANDVAMLHAAHIGVGIVGKEGTQAAGASDYAIRQFSHLKRLLFVHGRYSLIRNASLVQFSLYKNAAMFLPELWFALWCGFSGKTIYDVWTMAMFNTLFTSLQPLYVGLFERDIGEQLAMKVPQAYGALKSGYFFSYTSLAAWILDGVMHSLIFFFGAMFCLGHEVFSPSGLTSGFMLWSNLIFASALLTIMLKFAVQTYWWTYVTLVAYALPLAVYLLWSVWQNFSMRLFSGQFSVFGVMIASPLFYFWLLFIPFACLLPDLTVKFIRRRWLPQTQHELQEYEKMLGSPSDDHSSAIAADASSPLLRA